MNVDELRLVIERSQTQESFSSDPPPTLIARAKAAQRHRRVTLSASILIGMFLVAGAMVAGVGLTHRSAGPSPATPPARIGAPATWTIYDPQQQLSAASTSFNVVVSRIGCNGGRPEVDVYPPRIRYEDAQIVVTILVAPLRPGVNYTCQDVVRDPPYTYEVNLDQPIGARSLVDGTCLPGQPGEALAACTFVDPDRWTPPTN